jgi:hypothetical protein
LESSVLDIVLWNKSFLFISGCNWCCSLLFTCKWFKIGLVIYEFWVPEFKLEWFEFCKDSFEFWYWEFINLFVLLLIELGIEFSMIEDTSENKLLLLFWWILYYPLKLLFELPDCEFVWDWAWIKLGLYTYVGFGPIELNYEGLFTETPPLDELFVVA